MKKPLFILFISIMIIGCNNKAAKNEKTWVYLEVYYVTKNDTTADYIYGKIHKNDLDKIKSQSDSKSLFELTDGRYLDDNQIPHDYSNEKQSGTFFYRIKDVVYLEIHKHDPLIAITDTITVKTVENSYN